MNINKTSLIYKYLDEGYFNEGVTEPPYFIPTNLCPYMRLFCFNVLWQFAIGFIVLFIIQCMLWLPVYIYLGLGFGNAFTYLELSAIVGVGAWSILIIAGVGGFFIVVSPEIARIYHRTLYKAFTSVSANIFYQWYKAAHDKVCPNLTFVDK